MDEINNFDISPWAFDEPDAENKGESFPRKLHYMKGHRPQLNLVISEDNGIHSKIPGESKPKHTKQFTKQFNHTPIFLENTKKEPNSLRQSLNLNSKKQQNVFDFKLKKLNKTPSLSIDRTKEHLRLPSSKIQRSPFLPKLHNLIKFLNRSRTEHFKDKLISRILQYLKFSHLQKTYFHDKKQKAIIESHRP